MAHRDIAIAVRDRVAALVAQGKTEDEVVAADLDAKIQQAGTTGERFVRQAYADIKATR
jgi:cyclase